MQSFKNLVDLSFIQLQILWHSCPWHLKWIITCTLRWDDTFSIQSLCLTIIIILKILLAKGFAVFSLNVPQKRVSRWLLLGRPVKLSSFCKSTVAFLHFTQALTQCGEIPSGSRFRALIHPSIETLHMHYWIKLVSVQRFDNFITNSKSFYNFNTTDLIILRSCCSWVYIYWMNTKEEIIYWSKLLFIWRAILYGFKSWNKPSYCNNSFFTETYNGIK